jgi:hypothetical protein
MEARPMSTDPTHDEDDTTAALTIITRQIAAAPSAKPRLVAQFVMAALTRAGFSLHRHGVSVDWPDDYLSAAERAKKAAGRG